MRPKEDPLTFPLALNEKLADRESRSSSIVGPGLPPGVENVGAFVTDDRITSQQPIHKII